MAKVVLDIENVSKLYRLGQVGTGTLVDDLRRYWSIRFKGVDPYATIGVENDRTVKGSSNYVWALKDINLQVREGDVIGLIGRNGAGKSTLLKLLSGVTTPTTGRIRMKGKLASLLEVGTGFHPELTGRENIFLNGAILGMTKNDVNRKLDEIIEFSGVAKYIDTPVKRYSSGMKVRLGFAVAAHLEPDILIVDEVLAVGDAEFQKKAIGKMQDVSLGKGRSVIFVSHSMLSVKRLCEIGCVMDKGSLVFKGSVESAISRYMELSSQDLSIEQSPLKKWDELNGIGDKHMSLLEFSIQSKSGELKLKFDNTEDILLSFLIKFSDALKGVRFNLNITDELDNVIFCSTDQMKNSYAVSHGVYKYFVTIPGNLLNERRYFIRISAGIPGVQLLIPPTRISSFEVFFGENDLVPTYFKGSWPGLVFPTLKWERIKQE